MSELIEVVIHGRNSVCQYRYASIYATVVLPNNVAEGESAYIR
jgi:hypothetical protein